MHWLWFDADSVKGRKKKKKKGKDDEIFVRPFGHLKNGEEDESKPEKS